MERKNVIIFPLLSLNSNSFHPLSLPLTSSLFTVSLSPALNLLLSLSLWEGGVVVCREDSYNISHTLYKNATPGFKLKFGDAVENLPVNLDVKPGTVGGAD